MFYTRREHGRGTRAISLVVSRGFGTHIGVTLWWWSFHWHRRDRRIEAELRAFAERQNRQRSASP